MSDLDAVCARVALLSGCVNARPFRGKAAGTLVWRDCEVSRDGRVRVLLAHDPAGWNNVPWKGDGKRYPIRDQVGESLYPPAVFPEGWEYRIEERVTAPAS